VKHIDSHKCVEPNSVTLQLRTW